MTSWSGSVAGESLFSSLFISNMWDDPYTPAGCPDCGEVDLELNHIEMSATDPNGDPIVITSDTYNGYQGFNLNATVNCSLTVSIPVEIWAEITDIATNPDIWRGYSDRSPHGTSRSVEVYYVPTGSKTVTKTVGSVTVTNTQTFTGAALITFQQDFKYGIDTGSGTVGVTGLIAFGSGFYIDTLPTPEEVGNVNFSGFPSTTGVNADVGTHSWCYCTFSGGNAKIYSKGNGIHIGGNDEEIVSMDAELLTGQLTYTHWGNIKHLNGTNVQGMVVQSGELGDTATDTTDGNGDWSIPKTYDGSWAIYCHPGAIGEPYANESDPQQYSVNNVPPSSHGPATIKNLISTKDPWFPIDTYAAHGGMSPWGDNFCGGNDGRLDMTDPFGIGGGGSNVLELSAPYSKDVFSFSAVSWTVALGSATVTTEPDGRLKVVTGSSGATLQVDLSAGNVTLAGARFGDITYSSSDDPDVIQWGAQGHTWNIMPSSYRVDLGAPDDLDSQSDCETFKLGSKTVSWSWGVRNPGTMRLVGLRANKTYYFDRITLRRLTQQQGGYLDVYVYGHGPYVGADIGDDRSADSHLGLMVGQPSTDRFEQSGIVIVDGIIAAELCGVHHYPGDYVYGEIYWAHEWLPLNDARFLTPSDGMVEKSYPSGAGTALAPNLTPGPHYGNDFVTLSADGYFSSITTPLEYTVRSFSYQKWLKGHTILRVIDTDKKPRMTQVVHKKYIRDGGALLLEEILQTDSKGFLITAPLDQPHAEDWTITGVDMTNGTWITVASHLYNLSDYVGCNVWFGLYEIENGNRFFYVDHIDGDHIVLSGSLVNPYGNGYGPYVGSHCYPLDDYVHEFAITDKDNNQLSKKIQVRNHALLLLALKATLLPLASRGISITMDPACRTFIAYVQDGIRVIRSDNWGAIWDSPTHVTDDTDSVHPSIQADTTKGYLKLLLVYHKPSDGKLYLTTSQDEGRNWSAAVQLWTGSHPFILEDITGMKLLFYQDGTALKVRRSTDDFSTWLEAAQTVVTGAADDSIVARMTGDAAHRVMLTYVDSGGALQTVFSSANGLPPYA